MCCTFFEHSRSARFFMLLKNDYLFYVCAESVCFLHNADIKLLPKALSTPWWSASRDACRAPTTFYHYFYSAVQKLPTTFVRKWKHELSSRFVCYIYLVSLRPGY
ncbi:hypothetical protein PR048_023620 [Dryococelus australis]|uniref:Secreted protein n=1 Tax=Dryococelus australis TaxID=614101 RepID=A0ABQ9GUN8_9NEOP|nr:hypothetical protein PR048_023620 [Dryococelus australis]